MKFFILLCLAFSVSYIHPQDKLNLHLYLRVYLQGDYKDGKMLTTLSEKNIIPVKQPYNSAPWNYNGNEKATGISRNVVDWILVQLATADYKEEISRACFVKDDGSILDVDGNSFVRFDGIDKGAYLIIIYHRNHLPLLSAKPLEINSDSLMVDFTNKDSAAANLATAADLGDGHLGMICGDSNSDGEINKADVLEIAKNIFKTGYYNCDLDMNGIVNVLDYKRAENNLLKKVVVPSFTLEKDSSK